MLISYNKLWKLLVDKKMSKADLRKAAGIAPNTMTRLRRDEEVTLTVLYKICNTLNVNIGDIMEFLPVAEMTISHTPLALLVYNPIFGTIVASISPERVPIIKPALGVSPIDVFTHLPFSTAERNGREVPKTFAISPITS